MTRLVRSAQKAASAAKAADGRGGWFREQRLRFIEARLFWSGRINRADLVEQFGIHQAIASKDLTTYQRAAPRNAVYDLSQKMYVAGKHFRPLYDTVDVRQLLGHTLVGDRFASPATPFEALLPPARRIDGVVARNIMQAAGEPADVHCHYRSMENPAGAWRWIRPTAVINDGSRWHVRAYCHERRDFRDFLLSRIEAIGEMRQPFEAIPEDRPWINLISFEVRPHSKLKPEQQILVAYDYAMTDERLQLRVREALVKYVLINLGLDRELSPPRQVLELCDPAVRRHFQF